VIERYWKEWQQTRSSKRVRASLALCGHHVFTLISKRVDETVVRPLLPQEVELGPAGPDGQYLLLYTFGYQQFVRYAWGPPIFSLSYLECIIAVPNVLVPGSGRGNRGPFGALAKLYTSSLVPLILGRLIGYPKFLGKMSTGESSYRVETPSGRPVVSAAFQLNGMIVNPFWAPGYEQFRDLSSAAAVTKTPLGNFLCSIVEFDQAAALAQPVIATIEVQAPDFPGLRPGIHTFIGTDAEPLNAMRAHFSWTLTTRGTNAIPDERSSAGVRASG
jgi:hypothetical protein